MAEDQLRSIIETVRARLQAELETHLGSLVESHASAIAETRRNVEAAAEQHWTSKLDEARGEWHARLTAETAAARADAERAMSAEVLRVRSEAEQLAAGAAAQARRDLEDAVAAERTRAQADLERAQADRERAHADLERAHADLERAQTDRERAHTEHERLTVDLQRAFGELDRAQADLQRVQGEFASTQVDLQRVQGELASTQADLRRVQGELASTQADLRRVQEELAPTQADRERIQTDLDRTQTELERARTEHQRAHGELQRAQADLGASHSDLQRMHVELATAQADVACAKEDVVRTRQELRRAHDELQRLQVQLDAARDEAAAASTPRAAGLEASSSSGLLDAIRAIDQAPSLSEALAATVRGAALESPRVALFIVNGGVLQEWPVEGVPSLEAGQFSADGEEAGFLADVVRSGEARSIAGSPDAPAPAFAELRSPRRALAVPLVLGGQPVAVLYADEGVEGEPLASWRESIQILGRHASACLAHLTAVRTAQAMNLVAAGSASNGTAAEDEEHGARRYARLLVSEIKMYNDSAVRAGRERRDLLQRLKPEIDRARQLYEQRIAPSHARDHYFRQELVQTLADGDHSLLG